MELNDRDDVVTPPETLNIVKLNAIDTTSKREWFLEGAIPMRFYTICYGEGGMGKSLFANYLGIQACRGGQLFCGLQFLERPVKTLLLDYELDEYEQKRRLDQISKGLCLSSIPENFLYAKPKKPIMELIPEIANYVHSESIEFIIADSITVAGVDPLEVMSYKDFANQLRDLNVTCLLIDHQAKQQATGYYRQKSAYGTVYKRNLARSEFQIAGKATSENVISVEMVQKKNNFGRILDPLNFNMVFEDSKITFENQATVNPDLAHYDIIEEAIRKLQETKPNVIQSDILKELKDSSLLSKDRILYLLNKGKGIYWKISKGTKNSNVYELIDNGVELLKKNK